jgi:hypothetical protein
MRIRPTTRGSAILAALFLFHSGYARVHLLTDDHEPRAVHAAHHDVPPHHEGHAGHHEPHDAADHPLHIIAKTPAAADGAAFLPSRTFVLPDRPASELVLRMHEDAGSRIADRPVTLPSRAPPLA